MEMLNCRLDKGFFDSENLNLNINSESFKIDSDNIKPNDSINFDSINNTETRIKINNLDKSNKTFVLLKFLKIER